MTSKPIKSSSPCTATAHNVLLIVDVKSLLSQLATGVETCELSFVLVDKNCEALDISVGRLR
ncbi:hypothetical protein [Pseudomonas silesiensis]|uniref:hypothetical protein n=1 Tax=Pseudomonas silesiensis TaxID=1853130 RepID=UPI0030D9FBB2